MSFTFPADKLDFTAPNGITYTWDARDDLWRVKTFRAEDPDVRLPYRVETEPAGDPQVQLIDAQDEFSSVKFEGSNGIDVTTDGPDTLSFSGATLTPRDLFETDQARQDGTIETALEIQADLVDNVETLNNKVNALEGSVIDAIWTFEQDDRIPREGEFALRSGVDAVTGDWAIANQIIFNTTDFKGDTYTFEKITVNDVIRCGAADGTGAEYKVTSIIGQGWFGVEHLRSSPDAADEQEYAFTFLSAFDPEGLATIAYVDAQDDLKLNLTGGTLTNRLFFERGSGGANMVISPNSGDVNTAIYALNGGYLRLRSSLTEDLSNGVNTHITFGRNPDTNQPQTNIYHLQEPQEAAHAATKNYVDTQIGNIDIPDPDLSAYLPLTGGTITGQLTMQGTDTFYVRDSSGTENFRIQPNGFCRTLDLFRAQRDDGGPGLQCRVGTTLNAEVRCDGRATFKTSVKKDGKELATEEHVSTSYVPLSGGVMTGRLDIDNSSTAAAIRTIGLINVKKTGEGLGGANRVSLSGERAIYDGPVTNNTDIANKKYVDDKLTGGRFYVSSGSLYFEVD